MEVHLNLGEIEIISGTNQVLIDEMTLNFLVVAPRIKFNFNLYLYISIFKRGHNSFRGLIVHRMYYLSVQGKFSAKSKEQVQSKLKRLDRRCGI